MTEPTKWPEHIIKCLEASIKYGPGARFTNDSADSGLYGNNISSVTHSPTVDWKYIAPRPVNTEEWGNEYLIWHGDQQYWQKTIFWHTSMEDAKTADLKNGDTLVALHHRILGGTTQETLRFSTLKMFSKVG